VIDTFAMQQALKISARGTKPDVPCRSVLRLSLMRAKRTRRRHRSRVSGSTSPTTLRSRFSRQADHDGAIDDQLKAFDSHEQGLLATWETPDALFCVPRFQI
jgi:hypothetical protein